MSTLEIKNLSVNYAGSNGQNTLALSNVDLTMNTGDFVVALGASGCGKTTLLSCIAGFMQPSEGSITLDGKAVFGPGAERGVVFQKHALMPWLSVIENVEFGLKMRGMGEPLGALDALTRAHIQDLIVELWWQTRKMFFFITHSVEEALFLATDLIVMTPSPGRIEHRFKLDFSRQFIECKDSRKVKASPEFILMREQVLSLIHDDDGQDDTGVADGT